MNAERVLISAECVGNGRWFIDKATERAKELGRSGGPSVRTRASSSPLHSARIEAPPACATLFYLKGDWGRGEHGIAHPREAAWEAGNVAMQTYGGCWLRRRVRRRAQSLDEVLQEAPSDEPHPLHVAEHVLGLPLEPLRRGSATRRSRAFLFRPSLNRSGVRDMR